ncbi:MAG: hypothetical protein QNJ58_12345 [Desulfobacterales bacterium]|nr:hypothetical protein [Desulfobacterales bacterium]
MDDPAPGEKPSGSFELMDLGRRVIATLAILPQYNLPDLRFEIRQGYFNLSDAKQKIFELREIKAVFKGPLNDRQLNLHCRSNLWHDVTMIARADMDLLVQSGKLSFSFEGNLKRQTVDGLLLDNQILHGWIRGDLRAEIYLDRTRRSTANGKLAAKGLSLPGKPPGLPDIKSLSIAGAKNRLIVNSAEMTWNDSHLKLAGKMNF